MKLSFKDKKRLIDNYGQWAIVTGATSGIGLEIATLLADSGFNLVINARNIVLLNEVADKLTTSYNIQVKVDAADISEEKGAELLIKESKDLPIGLLVNNAGFGTSGLFVDSELNNEIKMLELNCRTVLILTHYFAQKFKKQKSGGIIFLSSLVAFQGVPYATNYAATKAFIQSFAEGLEREMKPFGVSVLAASPGPVNTGFAKRAKMTMNGAIAVDKIGVPILRALGNRRNVLPGFKTKFLIYSLRTVPRFFKIKIMEKIMKGFSN